MKETSCDTCTNMLHNNHWDSPPEGFGVEVKEVQIPTQNGFKIINECSCHREKRFGHGTNQDIK